MQPVTRTIFGKVCPVETSKRPVRKGYRRMWHRMTATLYLGQFETELRAERQREGIRKAKERGVQCGRSKHLSPQQSAELRHRRAQGVLIKTLMHDYHLAKASVYRYLSEPNFT
jgi:hypothetical protein